MKNRSILKRKTMLILLAVVLLSGNLYGAPLQAFAEEETEAVAAEEAATAETWSQADAEAEEADTPETVDDTSDTVTVPGSDEAELAPEEETDFAEAKTASLPILYLSYGTAKSESGLSWDGNGNLTLNNYKTSQGIGIYTNHKSKTYNATVTVKGDCRVGQLCAIPYHSTSTSADYTRINLKITGGGTLQIQHTGRVSEASAMIETSAGTLTVEDVTLKMVSTRDGSHGHGFCTHGDNDTITIKNCNIQTTLSTGDSFGIWTSYRAPQITLENTDWTLTGTNAEFDSAIIDAPTSDVNMKNVRICATGKIADGIDVKTLNADNLTLDVDYSADKSVYTKMIYARNATINNSNLRVKASELLRVPTTESTLSMTNTVVNATIYAAKYSGDTDCYAGVGIYGNTTVLQGCDVKLTQIIVPKGNGGQLLSGDYLTIADSTVSLADNTGANVVGLLRGNKNILCKGNSVIEATVSQGYALYGPLSLQDQLAIVSPAGASAGKTTNGVQTVIDQNRQAVKTLKIAKGTGTGNTGGSTGSGSTKVCKITYVFNLKHEEIPAEYTIDVKQGEELPDYEFYSDKAIWDEIADYCGFKDIVFDRWEPALEQYVTKDVTYRAIWRKKGEAGSSTGTGTGNGLSGSGSTTGGTGSSSGSGGSGTSAVEKPTGPVYVKSLKLNKTTAKLDNGKTLSLKATVKLDKKTPKKLQKNMKKVTWTSSNPAVATVSSSGKVKAKASGTATITARTKDGSGLERTCTITVASPVKKASISPKSAKISLPGNTSIPLTANWNADADVKEVRWSVKGKGATITQQPGADGINKTATITVSQKGKVTVTATVVGKNGKSKKVTCKITVTEPKKSKK